MKTIEFEQIVKKHSLMPNNDMYNSNGLCGECGEVANVIKKIAIRNHLETEDVKSMNTMDDYKNNLNEELGDALFYLTRIILDNNMTLNDIMKMQVEKLQKQSENYGRIFYK